jgi:hypothetical protein
VDVVVPSYQYGRYLRECVTSVLTQDISDLRVLIIDNASTDDSMDVARQLAAADDRVEVVARGHNLGPHASFNEGIDWARGDYFLILCADDILSPGALSRATAIMEARRDIAFVHGEAALLSTDETPLSPTPVGSGQEPVWRTLTGEAFITRFCRSGFFRIAFSTVVVRTAAQKQAGHYRQELPHTDDYEMWMRLALMGAVGETPTLQAYLRNHGENRTAQISRGPGWQLMQTKAALDSFFAREGAAMPSAANLHRLAERNIAGRAYWSAISNCWRGRWRIGAELMSVAFALRPTARVIPPLDYLFQHPDSLRRAGQVIAEKLAWRQTPIQGNSV